ncbi:MAG TPA: thiamine phosphate synthase [Acidimicrobiales bacterium]|nr:thiamine phosphate synthase [Acidimicrobiales bacterium]
MSGNGTAVDDRRLYLCTPDRPDLHDFIGASIAGGVDIVQLRDKDLEAGPLVRRATLAAELCHTMGVPFIVNDRPDIALAVGADGVHLGQDDVSPEVARRILGPGAIIGLSTHGGADLQRSRDEPVDYISAGPVEPTPTKPGRPGTGLSYITEVSVLDVLPFFVTGGVRPERIGQLVAAGASRFVVVRYLTESTFVEASARRLRNAIDEALTERASG